MSKKLEEKQQRRLAEERKRREQQRAARKRNFLTISIAVLVGALVVGLIIMDRESNDASTEQAGVAAGEAGCTDVQEIDEAGRTHVEEGTDVQYETSPPTSGDHYGTPADAGFYPTSVPEETLVHNLEHGQIVIWYRPDAPQATIDAIETVVEDEPIALLAAPYQDVPTGSELSFTAWGAMQSCADFSNAILSEFRAQFQGQGPEQVGIPTFDG
ncbi:MAG: DUF3105 domain-containing protein [Actinomycetota bacterium]